MDNSPITEVKSDVGHPYILGDGGYIFEQACPRGQLRTSKFQGINDHDWRRVIPKDSSVGPRGEGDDTDKHVSEMLQRFQLLKHTEPMLLFFFFAMHPHTCTSHISDD